MNKIIYSEKPLFSEVGNNILLVHTVSLRPLQDKSTELEQIKTLYTPVYKDYVLTTETYKKQHIVNNLLGRSYWFGYDSCKQKVALIYVSRKFGKWQDPLIGIRRRTISGLEHLLENLSPTIEVHCSKLNKDNFNVPWFETSKDINKILEKFPKHRIIVHS
jgi:hypothetical protein